VLSEVHAHYRHAAQIASRVDRVYDFVLTPLILHACSPGTAVGCATGWRGDPATRSPCWTPATASGWWMRPPAGTALRSPSVVKGATSRTGL